MFLYLLFISVIYSQTLKEISISHYIDDKWIPRSIWNVDLKKHKKVFNNVTIPSSLYKTEPIEYLLKVSVDQDNFYVSFPLCLLQSSRFQDSLILHLDENQDIIHIDYHPTTALECTGIVKPKSKCFKTSILIHNSTLGERAQLQELPETPNGQPPPPQSFLQKYWMYILPIMILLLLPGGQEEPRQATRR